MMSSRWMRAIAAAGALLAAPLAAGVAAAQDGVKLGFAGALTGPVAAFGNDIKKALEMATEAVNAKGGVRGKPMSFVARDDEHDPVKTVAAYRDLIERQKVHGMIGATNSASMLAVAPLINDQYKIPVICVHTDANDIIDNAAQKEGRDNYLFRLGMFGSGQADFLVDSMVKKFGFKEVGLLTWTAGWGQIGRKELTRRLGELGMKPVADETFDSGDTDVTAQILKLKGAGAKVILHYGTIREAVSIFQTQRKLGDPIPFVSSWGIAVPALWKAAGDLAEGTINSNVATVDGLQPPERQAVIDAYRKRYGQEFDDPAGFFATYDAVMLFARAIEKVGTEPAAIRVALEDMPNFHGISLSLTRPVFSKARHDGHSGEDMMLGRWTQGKFLRITYDETGPFVTLDDGQKKYVDTKTFALK
jgi:branched-chain amino acid transport system substrate-binding protein